MEGDVNKAKTIIQFFDSEGIENGMVTLSDDGMDSTGVDILRLEPYQEHIYADANPPLSFRTVRRPMSNKEVCEDGKHEYGSEEYRSDGKPFYKCNKCDKEIL